MFSRVKTRERDDFWIADCGLRILVKTRERDDFWIADCGLRILDIGF
jgi:hypothetical protein